MLTATDSSVVRGQTMAKKSSSAASAFDFASRFIGRLTTSRVASASAADTGSATSIDVCRAGFAATDASCGPTPATKPATSGAQVASRTTGRDI